MEHKDSELSGILKKQAEILERLKRGSKKDIWDKLAVMLPLLSGLLIAAVGGYFTYIYDSHSRAQEERIRELQQRQLEIEISNKGLERIDRLMPLINGLESKDESQRALAKMKLEVLIPPERFDAVMRFLEFKSLQKEKEVFVAPVLKEYDLHEKLDNRLKEK